MNDNIVSLAYTQHRIVKMTRDEQQQQKSEKN